MLYIDVAFTITVYAIIFFITYRIYKRQQTKGAWWGIILLIFIGIFSISLDVTLFGHTHKLAILPLGAGLFYAFTRNRNTTRETYKPYVWLGFLANYGFFIAGIITIFVINALFPASEISTYIKSLEKADVLATHISVSNNISLTNNAGELLEKSTPTTFDAHEWHFNQRFNQESYKEEKFPYMLQNVTMPAGLYFEVLFYVEQDGKGLLVQTPEQHYYFRTSEAFVKKDGE